MIICLMNSSQKDNAQKDKYQRNWIKVEIEGNYIGTKNKRSTLVQLLFENSRKSVFYLVLRRLMIFDIMSREHLGPF